MDRLDTHPAVATLQRDQLTWVVYGLLGYYTFMLNVLGPALQFLQREQGLSYTVSSLHSSALAVGMLLASLAGPALIARLGRRWALWLGGVGLTGASLLFVSSGHPAGTLTSALAMGGLGTLLLVVIPAVLADRHPAHRAAALTEANVGGSIGSALAPLLIGLCAQQGLGWRGAVLAGAASFGLLALWLATTPREAAGAPTASAVRHDARLPARYWGYWGMLVLVVAIEFALVFWAAAFLVAERGWAAPVAAMAGGVFFILMAVGRAAGAVLTSRVGDSRILGGSLLLALLGVVAFWLSPHPASTLLGLAFAGLGVANLYPLTLARAVATAPGQADAASARAALASGVAILSGPLLLGALADRAGLWAGYAGIPALVLAAMVVLRAVERSEAQPYAARALGPERPC